MITNYYCDESCHKENDESNLMFLSTVYCARYDYVRIKNQIKNVYENYNMPLDFEIKSTKVSNGRFDFYKSIVNTFLNEDALRFRCIVADKTCLNHEKFNQTHEDWYYKMYYQLIEKSFLTDENKIFIDYKDRHSYKNCKKIEEYLNRHFKKDDKRISIQTMDSKESKLMQINDLLMGLVAYKNKHLMQNTAKIELVKMIEKYFRIDFERTNYNDRFNIFHWHGGSR